MKVAVILFLIILGAGLGSFACCQAWRIRKGDKSKRSHCMNCKYQLRWYDNIPIISWLMLGGKCRKCRKKIGCAEIIAELLLPVVFVISFLCWPNYEALQARNVLEIIKFGLFLMQTCLFMILAVYDAKWKEMPSIILYICIGVAAAFWGVNVAQMVGAGKFEPSYLLELGGAMLILPGFYFAMYAASKEKWVGSGDAVLCVALALMLGKFWLAMFCLFGSNMIGSLVMVPVTAAKKEKHAMIPFGPFLIIGFLVVYFLQDAVMKFVSF